MTTEATTIVLEPTRRDPRGVIGMGLASVPALVLLGSWSLLAPLGALRGVALGALVGIGLAAALRALRRVEHAVVFGAEAALVKGAAAVFAGERRIPYRRIRELERRTTDALDLLTIGLERTWLPVCVGGRRVAAGGVAGVERELRARIAALPDGPARLGEIEAARRAPLATGVPWVTLGGVALLGLLFPLCHGRPLRLATHALLLLTLGLSVECWLGSLRTLVVLALAGAMGFALAGATGLAGALVLGLVGPLVALRALRGRALPLASRPALDAAVLLGLALLLGAVFEAERGALAAFAVALGASPLLLRGWPPPPAPS